MYDFLEYMFINTVSFYGLRVIFAGIFIALVAFAFTRMSDEGEKTEDEWKALILRNMENKKLFVSGIGIYAISIITTFFISIIWFKLLNFLGIHIALENILPIVIPSLIFIFTFIKFIKEKDEFIESVNKKIKEIK